MGKLKNIKNHIDKELNLNNKQWVKKQMINILHYLSGLAEIKAGMETYIINLYDHIDRDNFSFSILTRNVHKGSELYKMLIEKGIKVYDLDIPNLGLKTIPLYVKCLNSFFKEHCGEFDFIHMHGYDDPFVIYMAKHNGIKKAALHVHFVARENARGVGDLFKRIFSKNNMQYADYYFACSQKAGEVMYRNKKYIVLKNTIDAQKFQFDTDKRLIQREQLELKNPDIAISYTGRLVPVKNLGFLVDVFACMLKKNSNVKLFIIGEGEEKENLMAQVKSLKIDKNVCFLGERNDIDMLLQGMDLYLQTSIHEGFPFSLIESQCSGLPSVISDGFSEGIEITDLVHRISLAEAKEYWADKILELIRLASNKRSNRGQYDAIIKEKGYDCYNAANEMEKIYSGSVAL